MKRKNIILIILLMAISLIGITVVQIIWLNNAVNIKNRIFDRAVNEALQMTASRLESQHNLQFINKVLLNDTSRNYHLGIKFNNDKDTIISLSGNEKTIITKGSQTDSTSSFAFVKVDKDTQIGINSGIDMPDSAMQILLERFSDKGTSGNKTMFILNNDDTIMYNFDSLYFQGLQRFDSMIKASRIKAGNHLQKKTLKLKFDALKQTADKLAFEVYSWDMNEIDIERIKRILKEELANRDIPVKFRFGVFKDNKSISISKDSDTLQLMNSGYRVKLYPHNILQKNMSLSVYFIDRQKFIYRSIGWLLLSSLFFSLIILMTFALSLYYIIKQKKISEMKTDFINNMTHEFKTPIATISVAADSIDNEKVINQPEKIKYFTSMIKKENARMNRQVEDILTIARLDKQDFEFKWEPLDIHSLIKDAIDGIILQIKKRNGEIITDLAALNPVITCDKMHCTNVFYNLFDNAVKYSAGPPQITVSTKNNATGIMVYVEDNGIGMSKSVQAKVFERFYRKTTGNIHNVKGFGLGLSYVKAVVDASGGTVSLKSEQGKGSRFTLFFPFIKA